MDFVDLRKREFSRLDELNQAYLDYTGSGLYSKWQIDQHFKYLRKNVLGNPHTNSPSSLTSTEQIDHARKRVLDHFNAHENEYCVVFTQNSTGALKLVGEGYPFGSNSRYVLTSDNHNSVNGIREFARKKGARVVYIPIDFEMKLSDLSPYLPKVKSGTHSLFAFPAQSNFSGTRYPLEWIDLAKSRGYDVILDAAAYVPTNRLNLGAVKPDFVPVSFYKMFGYPTGVGALIARKTAIDKLVRPWFSGGTIDIVTTQYISHHMIEGYQRFEDGTPSFLDISAIPVGLTFLERVGMGNIHRHVMSLSKKLSNNLKKLKHSNGVSLIKIYGPANDDMMGSVISFNLITPGGTIVDSRIVGKLAKEHNISVRTGCFCNPGSGERFFNYSAKNEEKCIENMFKGISSIDDFPKCAGEGAGGAIRASLGIASNENDVMRLVDVLSTMKDCSEEINEEYELPPLTC